MRPLALAVLLVGCRLNFDPLTGEGDAGNGGSGGSGSGSSGILVDANVGSGGGGSNGVPCFAINDSNMYSSDSQTGTNLIIGLKLSTPTPLIVRRIEVVTGGRTATSALSLWSHDDVNDVPLLNYGTEPFAVDTPVQWYGADLALPVTLQAGSFWLGWTIGADALQSSVEVGGTGSVYPAYRPSFDGGSSWGPAFTFAAWKVRLYCNASQ